MIFILKIWKLDAPISLEITLFFHKSCFKRSRGYVKNQKERNVLFFEYLSESQAFLLFLYFNKRFMGLKSRI
jgi:hypothetical protein